MKNNWKIKRLVDAFQIKPPKNEAKNQLNNDDLVSFVPMEDLGILTKSFNLKREKYLKEVTGSYTYFSNNDVLLAKITPCFENGKIGIAKNLINGVGFGSSEFIVFRSKGMIIGDYLFYFILFYFLSTENFREEGKKRMTGAVGHKRLSKEFVENYLIPFPESISEQKRIVKILDQAFADIEKIRANTEKNLKNARELFESYLSQIFSTNMNNWSESELSKYIKFIDYRGKTPAKKESGIRLITAKNVRMGVLKQTPEEFVDLKSYDSWMTRGIPKKGDVLFTTEAPLANVAQLDTNEKVVFAQRIIIMQPNLNIISSEFLKYSLMSQPIQKLIYEKGTGATAMGIKARLLKKIPIRFPSLSQQEDIVRRLDNIGYYSEILEEIYNKKLSILDQLKKSLLQKAFSGQLTAHEEIAA